MKMQADLFGEPTADDEIVMDVEDISAGPLAVPCGWKDRANQPCRRLGHAPVMMDGFQVTCRGQRLVHCAPECFSTLVKPAPMDLDR